PLDGHAGRGVLERPPEAGLALAEGCLRVLAHLPEHEHEGHRASVAPHGGADFGRELAAVLAPADGLPALRPGRELARRQTAATAPISPRTMPSRSGDPARLQTRLVTRSWSASRGARAMRTRSSPRARRLTRQTGAGPDRTGSTRPRAAAPLRTASRSRSPPACARRPGERDRPSP